MGLLRFGFPILKTRRFKGSAFWGFGGLDDACCARLLFAAETAHKRFYTFVDARKKSFKLFLQ